MSEIPVMIDARPLTITVGSAQGVPGKSAYEVYVGTTTDDPVLNEGEWLSSLQGAPHFGDIAPDPNIRPLWFNTAEGKLYAYYDGFWIDQSGPVGPTGPAGATGPTGPTGPGIVYGDLPSVTPDILDSVVLTDASNANAGARASMASFLALLKEYFDTLYWQIPGDPSPIPAGAYLTPGGLDGYYFIEGDYYTEPI